MTASAIEVPTSQSTYGRVVCRIIRRVGDGDDTGTEPDALPMSGAITFTPLTKWDRTTDYSALASNEAITGQLNPLTGEMMSPGQPPTIGVDLLVGVYSVSFALDHGTFASFNVEVKASHTAVAPLDLAHEVPYSPPPGVQATMLVPSGITDGYLLSVSGGALVGVDPATLGGGSEVEQVTLTEDLAYTLPASVAPNRVHSVVFTQDATGGHTVTYGPDALAIDTDPGASTLVEIWPGGEVTYPGAVGSGGGVTDHGALTGLGDDDHTQYHTDARGDARYVPLARKVAGKPLSADVTLSAADLTDSTPTGRNLVTAADAAAARTAIGAGTSNLAIGTTGTTAAAGSRQASESAIGMVELATTAEATAGTDTTRAVTPAGLKAAVDAKSTSNTKTVNTITAAASVTVSTAYAVNKLAMTQNTTITPSLAAGSDPITALHLSGAFTPTFAASIKWPDGTAPTYTSPAVYVFLTVDGGTSWVGVQSGKAIA